MMDRDGQVERVAESSGWQGGAGRAGAGPTSHAVYRGVELDAEPHASSEPEPGGADLAAAEHELAHILDGRARLDAGGDGPMSMLPEERAARAGPYVEELLCQADAAPHARDDGGHDTPVAHVMAHASHVIAQVRSAGDGAAEDQGTTDGWDGFLDAVAQNESGGKARGHKGDLEIGAGTIGASGMDASYGRYQTTADKAVGVLRKNPEVAARAYGLSESELATLGDRMNATRAFWAVITEGRPAAIGRGKRGARARRRRRLRREVGRDLDAHHRARSRRSRPHARWPAHRGADRDQVHRSFAA